MNKNAIVIPTLNAARSGIWQDVLSAIAAQDFQDCLKIIVDSSSDDDTCSIATQYGWSVFRIFRKNFNHGETRNRICNILNKKGVDNVVFLSQDVILEKSYSLRILLEYLKNNDVAGCYGKQICVNENTLNWWQRQRCYPEISFIRNSQDIEYLGLRSVFFSNAFSAWKTASVVKYGGFPKTDFGEDTLLAFNVLKQGGHIGYCADAVVKHEHSNGCVELFLRGLQIGDFHQKQPDFKKLICKSRTNIKFPSIPISIILPLLVKTCGYLTGRFSNILLPVTLFSIVWLLALPAILFSNVPKPDIAARYAPMAESFANGDWLFAFHPRVTPLLTVCAGVIAKICNCTGFMACKLASTLLLALSVFPLWKACKKIYGVRIAFFVGLIFASSAYLLRLGYYGVREPGSILGLSIIFYSMAALYNDHKRWFGWIIFSCGEVLLLLSRGDMALFVLVICIAFMVFDCIKNHFPIRSLSGGVVILLLLLPLLHYNYRMIGYPVPEVRHAVVIKRIIERSPRLSFLRNPEPVIEIDIDIEMQNGGGDNE